MIGAIHLKSINLSFKRDVADVREAFRATVRADFPFLLFEPLLEASLAKMLTTAIREVRFIQYLSTDHAQVVIRELFNESILYRFTFRDVDIMC